MNEAELKRQLAEAGGASVCLNNRDPVTTGIKIACLAQYLKDKPDADQRAVINSIRAMGLDKVLDSMHFTPLQNNDIVRCCAVGRISLSFRKTPV